jgi:hypothetical protein
VQLSELTQPERIEFIKGAFAMATVWVGAAKVQARRSSSRCCRSRSHSHTHSHRH